MYNELKQEFEEKFKKLDLSFDEEYKKTEEAFVGISFDDPQDKYKVYKDVLVQVLEIYSYSPPKTKLGRFLRNAGHILAKILPFIKIK